MAAWKSYCARLCHPCDPGAQCPLASVHRLPLPAPIGTAKAEGQEQDQDEDDQDEDDPPCGHHLFNEKEKEH